MQLKNKNILITGGAGFIGSNLVDYFIKHNNVTVLDNLLTGKKENIEHHFNKKNFKFIKGDIRDLQTCKIAVSNIDIVFHQAALGSVPRSINDPITTNEINISGFLNMLIASRDAKVNRFVFAASSSTYGDSKELPKIEENIGKPLSPYAVSKYVNELYANVFAKLYNMEIIGLRYFNVFGKRQDPYGAYAAAIPLFIKKLIAGEQPIINGDGSITRDFTYIKNVVQINELAALTLNKSALNQIYNVAYGENINLNTLLNILKENLSKYNPEINNITPIHGPERIGDIHDSLASIEKAKKLLGYKPEFSVKKGLEEAIEWYWNFFAKNNK
jgi:UDP-N-acetylglucosamine 4-epimerase